MNNDRPQIESTDRPLNPQPGAAELSRVVAARSEGVPPDPADVDALYALRPAAVKGSAVDVAAVITDLHAEDTVKSAQAWAQLQTLLPFRLDLTLTHAPNPPPVSWLVKDWMPAQTLTVLTGKGGAGKSRIALQLAVAVALGQHGFLPPHSERRPLTLQAPAVRDAGIVVFAAWETRRLAWANRLTAICSVEEIAALDNRLHYVNMRPAGGLWGAAPGAHTSTAGGMLPGGQALLEHAYRAGARLLVIDPVAAAFVGNENDRALVRAFLSALDQWAEESGCTVLLISHPPKSDHPQSGSTDWRNGVQSVWELAPADKDASGGSRQLRVDKLNEGPLPEPVLLDYETGQFVEINGADGASQDKARGGNLDTSDL